MNILFIAIDTLAAGHMSCYGYGRKTSPNLDRFANESILFLNAFASDIPTQPAYTTMFTGLRGIRHTIVSHDGRNVLDPAIPVLQEILRSNGYLTCAVDNLVDMKPWFIRGYSQYFNPGGLQFATAQRINSIAIPWLEQNYRNKFFLFLHYWDPHTPYIPHEKYNYYTGKKNDPGNKSLERFKKQMVYPFFARWFEDLGDVTDAEYIVALYDGEISYVDEKLQEIFDIIEKLDILDDTLIIITSDHGESMTEHEIYFDHHGLYETTTHIPLIIKPQGRFKPRKIKEMVQHIDLMPTILELAGIKMHSKLDGRSLVPLLKGEGKGCKEVYMNECLYQAKIAIRTEDWKFIIAIDKGVHPEAPDRELYNLKDDPEEKINLFEKERDVVDNLELKLLRWRAAQLGNKPDPVRVEAGLGLPALAWVDRALKSMNLRREDWIAKQKYI